jgi:hypothetical protein
MYLRSSGVMETHPKLRQFMIFRLKPVCHQWSEDLKLSAGSLHESEYNGR